MVTSRGPKATRAQQIARFIGVVAALVVLVLLLMQRFQLSSRRASDAIDEAESAACRVVVAEGGVADWRRAARNAARLGPGDPYGLFLFQLARAADPNDGGGIPMEEVEREALNTLLDGELEEARALVTDASAEDEILSGRGELWLQLLGALDVLTRSGCEP